MKQIKYIFLLSLFFYPLLTKITWSYDMHGDVQDKAVQTNMYAMAAFQVHYTNFMFYTINVGTPGFIEQGVYNTRRLKGNIEYVDFKRFRAGPPVQTGRPLDFYLDASSRGFYVVKMPGTLAYTRDGRFQLDSGGRLVTMSGQYPVLGQEGEIFFPEDASANDVSVSRAGLLYLGDQEVDRLRIAVFKSFKEMQTMDAINGSFFLLTRPIEIVEGPEHYQVKQGWLEENNVLKAITGDILMAKNAYDANAKTAHLINRVLGSAASLASP